MSKKANLSHLKRYTTLSVLLDLLKNKHLVFLDPVTTWEDQNDAKIIAGYKEQKEVSQLFALCFSYGDETIHHWKTYAAGTSGCCVEFDGPKLRELFDSIKVRHGKMRHGVVRYKKINELGKSKIPVENIPFTKRWPYRCESEYRAIWEGETEDTQLQIKFDLTLISRITISQNMPEPVYQTIRKHLKQVFNNPDQRISRSTLFENPTWINHFKKTAAKKS